VTTPSEIIVTLGPCDDMRAEVFLRPTETVPPGTKLVGSITGPRRGRDTTLPATTRLVPLPEAADSGPASRAILTEPAFWTPDLPNLYRVEARLEPATGAVAAIDAWIGLRRLGVRGRSFWLDGRRWVPRAVAGLCDVAAAKAAAVELASAAPAAELLSATDELGVAVLPLLDADHLAVPEIAALARHPSAMLVVITAAASPDAVAARIAAVRRAKGTLLIGTAVDGTRPPPAGGAGSDFLVVMLPAGGLPHDGWRSPPAQPLVAWRQVAHVAAPRSACDALQRDLALWRIAGGGDISPWDWAGYLAG
jgi:hypothetical protein